MCAHTHTHTCMHTWQTGDPKLQKANILSSKTATVSSANITVQFLYGWHQQQQKIVGSTAILTQCYVVKETQLAAHIRLHSIKHIAHHHSVRSTSTFPSLPPKRNTTAIKDQALVSKSCRKQDVSADTEILIKEKATQQMGACSTPALVCVSGTLLVSEARACK